jgi:Ku protein
MQPLGRTLANSTISLGLLNAPVKLYKATGDIDLKFHMAGPNGEAVEQVFRTVDDKKSILTYDDCGRSFEGTKINPDDVKKINDECKLEDGKNLKNLNIEAFVPFKKIDFSRVEDWYYIAPDPKSSVDAFATIAKAMEKKKAAAICKWVARERQSLVALYVEKGKMYMVSLKFAATIRQQPEYELPKVDAKFVEAAETLMDQFFDDEGEILNEIEDSAIEKRLSLIEKLRKGQKIDTTEATPVEPVPDIMDALAASIEQAKKAPKAKKAKKVAA